MNKTYILNKETQKIELHFTKEEYQNLSDELKKELKSSFLFSRFANAWVSRSKNNHWRAINTAKKLGFTEKEVVGERLSYAEELERKAEKAERREERYLEYASNAEKRAENLQAEREKYRGDISFWTQPIISGHSGSERFARQRQRVIDRYNKGFEEYRKSKYFKERASIASSTASMEQLKSKTYINNRIEECNKEIRGLQRNIVKAEEQNNNEWLERLTERIEYEIDKLAFFQNAMDDLGGVQYSKDNLKVGYLMNCRHGWARITKLNPKTVYGEFIAEHMKSCCCQYPYAEIKEIKIPDDYQEPVKEESINPFEIGDMLVQKNYSGQVYKSYQVVKKSKSMITIREIKTKENSPIKDIFKSEETINKKVKQTKNGSYVISIDGWICYKYTFENASKEAI
jgi:hypothetical protein